MAISEYDSFGPWIYEISEAHPVPRLFAPHIPQNESAVLLFKIPRNIERRVATPDMDLYDYVVGAYTDYICVLKRQEDRVSHLRITYSEIECLCLTRHFLKGILTLYLKNGTVELPFNAVSMDIIRRFAAHIRSKQLTGNAVLPDEIREQQKPVELNLLFTNMLKDLKAEGETPLLYAYQPAVDRSPVSKTGIQSFFNRLHHNKMPAGLHILTPDELIVIRQDTASGKHAKEELLYHYFYFPLTAIKRAELVPCEDHAEETCVIALADHTFQYSAETGNPGIHALYGLLRTYLR